MLIAVTAKWITTLARPKFITASAAIAIIISSQTSLQQIEINDFFTLSGATG
jgi:hypothetical protein